MDLSDWLHEHQLGHLHEALREQRLSLDLLQQLDEATLAGWGLVWGDRRRLLAAIKNRTNEYGSSAKKTGPERRQMTVFFSDMVGSTALSTRVEPEEFREAIDRYIHAVNDAVAPYEGYVAKYMGDGILVYFGYPQAHEDDPARAVYSALRAVKAVSKLKLYNGESLQTRVGIATGIVIIDETGAGTAAAETAATGQTMNLAARLQAFAAPEEVVIADETRKRLGEDFAFEALHDLELKGFSDKITAWKVSERHVVSAGMAPSHGMRALRDELLGREEELATLWDRWCLARELKLKAVPPQRKQSEQTGWAQTVLLAGEPGIGKSTLTRALAQRIASDGGTVLVWKASAYFSNTALHPMINALMNQAATGHDDPPEQRRAALDRYADQIALDVETRNWLAKAVGLLRDPNLDALPAAEQKRRILAAIRAWLRAKSQRQAMMLLVEDGQLLDPSTEEVVASLALFPLDAPLLLIVTSRAEYKPAWSMDNRVGVILLQDLSEKTAESMITRITAGRSLPAPLRKEILARTHGNPLFLEEMTRSILESGLLIETANGFEMRGDLSLLGVPNSLQDSLMARLDRMGPYKEVAQVAAVIGMEFSQQVLSYVLSTRPPQMLKSGLSELENSGLLVTRLVDGKKGFAFRHPLMRDTAYSSLVKSQRAMRHWQVAKAIEVLEKSASEETPELLAQHHQEAGLYYESIRYWSSSGEKAAHRSAHTEATKSFRQGIALLSHLEEEPDCARIEFDLQMRLGGVLTDAEGFHSESAKGSIHRAIQISRELGNPDNYIDACASVSGTLQAKGEFQEVIRLLEDVTDQELNACAEANRAKFFACLGVSKAFLGTFTEAFEHLEKALEHTRVSEAQTKLERLPSPPWSIPIRAYGAKVLAYRGLLVRAQQLVEEAHALSMASKHAIERLSGLQLLVWIRLLEGRLSEAQVLAQDLYQQSDRLGIKVRLAGVMAYLGEIALAQGDLSRGSALLEEAFQLLQTYSGSITLPEFATRAADSLVRADQYEAAQSMLDRVAPIPLLAGRAFVQAEYLRLSGRLNWARSKIDAARENFTQAVATADQQGSGLFGLRAASNWLELELERHRNPPSEALEHLRRYLSCHPNDASYPDVLRAREVFSSAKLRQ